MADQTTSTPSAPASEQATANTAAANASPAQAPAPSAAMTLSSEESTSSRMNRMGSSLVTLGSCLTAGEVIERCEAVTAGDIAALAGELLAPEGLSLSAVGRVKSADEYREVIAKNA